MSERALFVNAKKAMQLLGISRATFYRRIQDGSIKPKQLGPSRVYSVAELKQIGELQ